MTIVAPVIPSRRSVAVIGHRGSRATHPENTLAAFQHALEIGADAVELDITPARDGILAVAHDPVRADFAELPAGTPRLEDVIEWARGNSLFLDVEAKTYVNSPLRLHEFAQRITDCIGPLAGRVALRSFNRRFLRTAHSIAPDIPLIVLTRRSAVRWVEICRHTHARAISPHHWLVTRGEVRRAHRAGIPVYAWTVNRPRDWRRMLRAGVDGVIADDPAALVAWLDQPAISPATADSSR